MIKIELVRFEAQDVITASGEIVTPAAHEHKSNGAWVGTGNGSAMQTTCGECGAIGIKQQGIFDKNPTVWED